MLSVSKDHDGKPLGGTEFASMHAAYEGLPDAEKERLADATVTHDYEKLWERMPLQLWMRLMKQRMTMC